MLFSRKVSKLQRKAVRLRESVIYTRALWLEQREKMLCSLKDSVQFRPGAWQVYNCSVGTLFLKVFFKQN